MRVPFWGPLLRPLLNTLFIDFGRLLGSIWGPFGTTFSALFPTSKKLQKRAQHEPVLAMEREARRKLKLCFINVLELANTHQQRYSRTAEITSTPQKKNWFLCTACPHHLQNLSNFIEHWLQISCFLGALGISNLLDKQVTDFLLKHDPQNGPHNH